MTVDSPVELGGKATRHGALIGFPPGTAGHAKELEVVDFLNEHREMGYGRMIQMLNQMWHSVDVHHVPDDERINAMEQKVAEKERALEDVDDVLALVLPDDLYSKVHARIVGKADDRRRKSGRSRVNISFTSKTDPFDAIRQKAIEAFDACDHIDYSDEENAKWLPIVQGLIADIECYCDFLGDVEMPNKKKED